MVQEIMNDINAHPIYEGSKVYTFYGTLIDTTKVESAAELCVAFFNAGQDHKTTEIKNVLKIIDPRV